MQIAARQQRLHQHIDAARLIHILGDIAAAGLEVGDIGRGLEDLGDVEQVEVDPRLVRHCWQVEAGIGRAAGRRHDARGIFERLTGTDIARTKVARDQFHHLLARRLGNAMAVEEGRRHHIAVGQRQADRLANAGHGVGGELAATGAVARAGDLFQCDQVVEWAIARRVLSDCLEHVDHGHVAVVMTAGQDRAAIDEDRGHVQAKHRHHHAGQRLVASRKADQRVIAMAAYRQFDRIGDHLAADQRGLHPLMAHGDTVGDGDGVEPTRHATAADHAPLRGIGLCIERGVARCRIIARARQRDEGLGDILFLDTHGVVIAAVRRALWPDGNVAGR